MAQTKIAVIGLGYVGLPLAVEFSAHYETVGFDINKDRVSQLNRGIDKTLEVSNERLQRALAGEKELPGLLCTSHIDAIKDCTIYIVTVPTPIDTYKQPDLRPLTSATKTVSEVLSQGDIVIYESTVYPGCTEEVCVPILEEGSGMRFNEGFFCGFSPERINPGDKVHTVTTIKKITSGSTEETAETIDALYRTVITAGTHKAPSIKIAEAAKVIENSQRDVNIAFVNELAEIFDRLGIDTTDVLEAAGTKWNFLPFRPGLVGGHCIGVDPYYLTHKAQAVGYYSQVILSGRRINDNMGIFVAGKTVKLMIAKGIRIKDATVLVLGMTFKENCPDIRNSRVIDVVRELQEFGCHVNVYDPLADPQEVQQEYGIELISEELMKNNAPYDAIILTVAHAHFKNMDITALRAKKSVVYDVKSFLPRESVDGRL